MWQYPSTQNLANQMMPCHHLLLSPTNRKP